MFVTFPAKKPVGAGGLRDNPRKTFSTSETFGRRRGSWFQQRCITFHNLSEHIGWVGRSGRFPSIIAKPAILGLLAPNGTALVRTCIETKRRLRKARRMLIYPYRTSTMTIANENTSASLLYVPRSFKISGAVHGTL